MIGVGTSSRRVRLAAKRASLSRDALKMRSHCDVTYRVFVFVGPPVAALILPIVLIGAGIGAAWAFVLQRVMSGAKEQTGRPVSIKTLEGAPLPTQSSLSAGSLK